MSDMLVSDFQHCCLGLLSPKVTVRHKNLDRLSEFLSSRRATEAIHNNSNFTWDSVLYYVNSFLLKEAEKLLEDEQKKSVSAQTYFKKKTYGDFLLDVAKIANGGSA